MKTPCINICAILPFDDKCIGCNRTVQQIKDWSSYTDKQRDDIMNNLTQQHRARESVTGIV
jgi:predicted Fe-S protein YdhL (DUF1289 family)